MTSGFGLASAFTAGAACGLAALRAGARVGFSAGFASGERAFSIVLVIFPKASAIDLPTGAVVVAARAAPRPASVEAWALAIPGSASKSMAMRAFIAKQYNSASPRGIAGKP